MSSKRAPLHIASLVERLDQLGLLLRSESRGLDRSDLVISAPAPMTLVRSYLVARLWRLPERVPMVQRSPQRRCVVVLHC